MKLIYCNECHDVVSLRFENRTCSCGESSGYYKDRINAVIKGPCIPLGFEGRSFRQAREKRHKEDAGMDLGGERFIAFVIPENCPKVEELG
jgi:hypothetical protein